MDDSTTSSGTERDVYPDTGSDVGAIIAGMGQAPQQDRTRAPLPDSLQPGYRPSMPTLISPTTGQPMPTYGYHTPDGRYVTGPQGTVVQPPGIPVPGSQPGVLPPEFQRPSSSLPRIQIASADPSAVVPPPQQVALNPPGRFSLGNQPGPWPAANPNSPRYDPATAPALPGETPDETAALNRFMAHETGNRGNIINDWAAKNPALYYDPKNPRTCQGYWQMVNSTWRDGARRAGVDLGQFPTAMTADYQTQRRVALALYRSYGDRPWRAQPGAGELGDREHLRPQQPLPAEPRGYQDWGKDPPGGYTPASARDFGPGPSGQQPGQFGQQPQPSGLERVLNGVGPLLMGIASLALHLPLSTAITAYGAMARAQDNGQREAYERNRTRMQDAAKEAAAQQTQESRDASDAFVEYGNNNPQGLQQQLAQIALKYNDPVMYRMAERGDLNGIHQLQQQRDLYNQDLLKGNRAAQEEQDRQAQNAAVQAMDRKWRADNPNATEDEAAIAHNEHIGEAARAGTKDPKAAGTGEEAKVYNVVDKDTGQPTGKQVRVGKNGGTFDLNGQPTQLAPNEKLGDEAGVKATQDKPEQEGEVRNVLGPDGKPTGQQVREGKTGGLFDPDSGERVHLQRGETIQQPGRAGQEGPKPSDYKDYTWRDSQDKPHGPSSAALVPGKGLVDPQGNPIDAKPETIRSVSTGAAAPVETFDPNAGKDAYTNKPNQPPPGVDISPGMWRQALTYVNTGKSPTFGRDRESMAKFREAVPVAMNALGVTDEEMNRRWIQYSALKTRENRIEAAFAGGQDGKTLLALNTVAHHIDLFRQYADAMRANDYPAMNRIIDNLARQGGAPELMDFNIVSRVTGDELVRVLTGTGGGTITDREDIARQLSAYSSPDQFEGAANTLTNVLRGRFGPLQRAYARGDPAKEKYFQDQMMEPEARRMFQGEQRPIPGSDSTGGPAPIPPGWTIQEH